MSTVERLETIRSSSPSDRVNKKLDIITIPAHEIGNKFVINLWENV